MIDRFSETWVAVRSTIDQRIEKLRQDLEIPGVEPEALRGEIRGLRWLIKQGEPDAPIRESTSTDYMQTSAPDPS